MPEKLSGQPIDLGGPSAARTTLLRLLRDESGQDLIEYSLLVALLSLTSVLSMKGLANKIGGAFNTVGNDLTNAL